MNVKVLEKIEKGWVRFEWQRIKQYELMSLSLLEDIVDVVDRFHKNKSVKELVLIKIKGLPAYITVSKNEYIDLLDWILSKFIEHELYELCHKIERIKSGIK